MSNIGDALLKAEVDYLTLMSKDNLTEREIGRASALYDLLRGIDKGSKISTKKFTRVPLWKPEKLKEKEYKRELGPFHYSVDPMGLGDETLISLEYYGRTIANFFAASTLVGVDIGDESFQITENQISKIVDTLNKNFLTN